MSANTKIGIVATASICTLSLLIALIVLATSKSRQNEIAKHEPELEKKASVEPQQKTKGKIGDQTKKPAPSTKTPLSKTPDDRPKSPDLVEAAPPPPKAATKEPKELKKEPTVELLPDPPEKKESMVELLPDPSERIEPNEVKSEPKETPVPGKLLREIVPGYETRLINGFTVLLSTQAIREAKKDGGKPFDALTNEFDGLVKTLPAHSLRGFRQVFIWIEWDLKDGNALARYYAASLWSLPGDRNELKANSIEVLSLKSLTAEKAGLKHKRLVLLHEMAHVVHHVLIGFDDEDVQFVYKQAMDRKLYDDVDKGNGEKGKAYAATNHKEYFAEISCAYLDRCSYYPFTKDDLKEHDPTGYKMMEQVWGKAQPPKKKKLK